MGKAHPAVEPKIGCGNTILGTPSIKLWFSTSRKKLPPPNLVPCTLTYLCLYLLSRSTALNSSVPGVRTTRVSRCPAQIYTHCHLKPHTYFPDMSSFCTLPLFTIHIIVVTMLLTTPATETSTPTQPYKKRCLWDGLG